MFEDLGENKSDLWVELMKDLKGMIGTCVF